MSRLLLDTTFLVDADRASSGLDVVIDDDDDVAVAAVTVAELRVGALLADDAHRADRAAFVDNIVEKVPIINYDRDVADAHAQLLVQVRRQGRPRGAHDLIIAATAKHSGRIVISADASAFTGLDGVTTRRHGDRRPPDE